MSKVKDLVETSKKNSKGKKTRKTRNQEEYFQMLMAVLTDAEYVAKNIKEIKNGEIITEERRIAPDFLKIIVAAFKKAGMSEAEAITESESFKLTKDMCKAIVDAVRETDYIITKECGKKIRIFNKPGFEFNMTVEAAKESIRPNPQNPNEKIRIKARNRVKIQQALHDFQKEHIKA